MSGWKPIATAPVVFDPEYAGKEALLWNRRYGRALGRLFADATGEVHGSASGYHGIDWDLWYDFGDGKTMPDAPEVR